MFQEYPEWVAHGILGRSLAASAGVWTQRCSQSKWRHPDWGAGARNSVRVTHIVRSL